MIPVEQMLIGGVGWQNAFYLLAALVVLTMMPLALLLREPLADAGSPPYQQSIGQAVREAFGYRPFLLHPWEQLNPKPCKPRTHRWPEVPRRARLARDVLNKVVANLTMQVSPVPIHCCKARWSLARRLKPLVQSVPIQVRRMCK
jgi:hypothetical protein